MQIKKTQLFILYLEAIDMSIPSCDLVIPVTNEIKIIKDITEKINRFFLKYFILIK